MVGAKSRQLISPPRPPSFGEMERARLMKLRVVQNDEPRITEEIRPHVVVTLSVPQLKQGEVVGLTSLLPHEVMGVGFTENLTLQAAGGEQREQFGRVRGDA
jgi:hypothetical protein